jgi:cytochrome c oxidase cbb3-type subunit 1
MWRTYSQDDTLVYSFVDSLVAMYPYYIARAFGGLLFLIGAIVAAYNIWMTVRTPEPAPEHYGEDLPLGTRGVETVAPSPAE